MSARKRDPDLDRNPKPLPHSDAFELALKEYGLALELLHKGDYSGARDLLAKVTADLGDEPELVERARTYLRVCEHKLAAPEADSDDPDECYYGAVLRINDGRFDEALQSLDRALQQDPTSVRCLYARASAWALKGQADRTVADLRQAIAIDPKLRFQAVNDPDFEKVREEPAFIDIIEPTPTGT